MAISPLFFHKGLSMIDSRLRLTVLTSTPVLAVETFTDRTEEACDFQRDNFTCTLDTTDYLYVGYRKPFATVYCAFLTPNVTANSLTFEYWNGTAWTALDARDQTKGLTRSGYVTWDKPADWTAEDVNGSDLFWVRAAPSATHSATAVTGMNLVFADDYDLVLEFPSVRDTAFLPSGQTSHLITHEAVRNEIISDLRSKGYLKLDANGFWQNLTPWDLHDVEEVKQAAVYLALSKTFFNYSDNPADHWTAKSKAYYDKYKLKMDTLQVSTDVNDDGLLTIDEAVPSVKAVRMYR